MTPGTVTAFRSFFRLQDVFCHERPDEMFEALVSVAQWAEAQRRRPDQAHDELLMAKSDTTTIRMGLLMHLATVDREFFNLARRMAARTLVRHSPPAPIFLHMAAQLLTAGDGPKSRKPALARDAALVLAVAVGIEAGWSPTESADPLRSPRSGCGKVAEMMGWEYARTEAIWKKREVRMNDAGFALQQVSEFFSFISPMIGNKK